MTDRLTLSRRDDAPRWVSWMPLLCLCCGLLILFRISDPLFAGEAFTEPPLLKAIPSGLSIQVLLTSSALLLLWCSGLLIRHLLPPKSLVALRGLAQSLGICATVLFAAPLFTASPALPAWALALLASLFFLNSAGQPLAALLAGICAGAALSLDAQTLVLSLPLLLWMLADLIRFKKTQFSRAILLLVGIAAGLYPFWSGRIAFVCPWAGGITKSAFPLLPAWTWFFMALGGIVALLQRLPVFIGLILPAFALAASLTFYGLHPLLLTLAQSWMTAYGIYRVLKGIENGVRNLDPERAKPLPGLFLFLLFAAMIAWTAVLYLPPVA